MCLTVSDFDGFYVFGLFVFIYGFYVFGFVDLFDVGLLLMFLLFVVLSLFVLLVCVDLCTFLFCICNRFELNFLNPSSCQSPGGSMMHFGSEGSPRNN